MTLTATYTQPIRDEVTYGALMLALAQAEGKTKKLPPRQHTIENPYGDRPSPEEVDKAVSKALTSNGNWMTRPHIAQESDIAVSTVHRSIERLTKRQLVEGRKKYGVRSFRWIG